MALLLYWFVCYDCTDGSIIKTIGSHGPIKTNVKNNRVVGTKLTGTPYKQKSLIPIDCIQLLEILIGANGTSSVRQVVLAF